MGKILSEFDSKMSELRDELIHAIDALEKAALQNPNMPARALQFMSGNRESYLRLSRQFSRDVMEKNTQGKNYAQIGEHIRSFRQSLEQFLSQSNRNYAVLQQFFAHESRAVAKAMRDAEVTMQELESHLMRLGFDALTSAKKEIEVLRSREALLMEITQKKRQTEAALEGTKKNIHIAKEHVEEFLKHADYAHYLRLKEIIKSVEEEEKRISEQLSRHFLAFDKPLRKFAKVAIENEGLVREYAEDAFSALKKDASLAIHGILSSLDRALENDGFGLDEKRVHKAREGIMALTKETIAQLRQRAEEAQKKRHEAMEGMKRVRAEERKRELEEALSRLHEEEAALQKSLAALSEQEASIDVVSIVKTIEEKSSELLKAVVKITEVK